jgi:hypothetical protein
MLSLRHTRPALLMLLILTSCRAGATLTDPALLQTAKRLQQNPLPMPKFVTHTWLQNPDGLYPKSECVAVEDGALWENGNYGSQLSAHIESVAQMSIDGHVSKEVTFVADLSEHHVYGVNREHLGSYGGGTTICAAIRGLAPGWHIATIRLTTMSGKAQAYSWTFEVK